MANWIGASRTNYVRLADGVTQESLEAEFERIGLDIEVSPGQGKNVDKVCFLPSDFSGDGSFQSYLFPDPSEDASDDEEFTWADHVMPHVAVGEVLVMVCAGAEKLRYVTGYAEAFVRLESGEVKQTEVSITDIYGKASEVFSVDKGCITETEY